MNMNSSVGQSIRLFRTSSHPCSYKRSRLAAEVFVDPGLTIDKSLNSKLSELGYRRSGGHLYRPDCESCSACISCRVPVDRFVMQRRHRKVMNANQNLQVVEADELRLDKTYRLYERYINTRHRDGDMYPANPKQFEDFINTRTADTRSFLFYEQERLLAVCVTDVLEQGLSAVYTFFEPSLPKRSLGNYVILWQIDKARSLGLPYLFLGYWIKDCAKMRYKSSFRPIEMLVDGNWILLR